METLVIGNDVYGEAVGELRVAHVRAAQERALERVVRENASLADVRLRAFEERRGIDKPLPGKAAVAEGVHVQLSAQYPVGIAPAAGSGNESEICSVGVGKIGADTRVYYAVAMGDYVALVVDNWFT